MRNRKVMTRLLAVLWTVPALLVLAGCGRQETPEMPPVVRPVKTLEVGGDITTTLSFPGTVQATDRSVLSFRVSGRLIQLNANEGDQVKKGQLLARLDPTDFEIAVAEALAAFQKGEADYRRYKRLYEREAVPLADVEMNRAMRDVAKARLDQAKANLSYTYLYAPYSGFVGRRFVENFEDVMAKEDVLSLQNVQKIEIVVDIPESLMSRIDPDLDGDVEGLYAEFASVPDKKYELDVKEIAAEADPETRTFRITLIMPQPEELSVFPGMTVRVTGTTEVAMEKEGAFAVPAQAVFAGDRGQSLVWVVDPETMTTSGREVKAGAVTGKREVWIESGLEKGEIVVVTAVHEIQEGDEIRFMARSY